MSIESVMPSNHLILCHPLLLLPSIFPSISLFQWVSSSHQVAKVLEHQLQHESFQWIFRVISLGLTNLISWQSKGLSKVFSSSTVWRHQFFSAQPFLLFISHTYTWLLEKPQLSLYGSGCWQFISGSSAFTKYSLCNRRSRITYCWSLAWRILSITLLVCAAAAAAESFQVCPTLCDPIDDSPPGFPVPGILQARTLEWVAISFSNAWKWKVKVKLLSHVRLFATPWASMWNEHNSMAVWTFFRIAFLWDWNEIWSLPVLWPLLIFQIWWHTECSTLSSSFSN